MTAVQKLVKEKGKKHKKSIKKLIQASEDFKQLKRQCRHKLKFY